MGRGRCSRFCNERHWEKREHRQPDCDHIHGQAGRADLQPEAQRKAGLGAGGQKSLTSADYSINSKPASRDVRYRTRGFLTRRN